MLGQTFLDNADELHWDLARRKQAQGKLGRKKQKKKKAKKV